MSMKGDVETPAQSKNIWVYKNFAYGYLWRSSVDSNYHTVWPQTYPAEWNGFATPERQIGRARFKVLDLRNVPTNKLDPNGPKHGFYVVLGQFSKSSTDKDFWNYARGIWEIVPGERFSSKEDVLNNVVVNNNHPAEWYNNSDSGHYFYKLTVSGETLKLDNKVGTGVSYNAIMEIRNASNAAQDLGQVFANFSYNSGPDELRTNVPLLDVKEVDANYNFGTTLAYAAGDGWLTVVNPYVGSTLQIDSSDYKNPRRPQE
jgi:hypothetical protein